MQTQQKLEQKRQQLIDRTMLALNLSIEDTRQVLSTPRQQSFRINTLRVNDSDALLQKLTVLGWQGSPITWCKDSYGIDDGFSALRDSEFAHNGSIYIQNAASWLPVVVLDPQPGERILDVCAAPGGKTSHIAQLTYNQAHITANDNSRGRLLRLQANLERLNVQNTELTLYDAARLSHKIGTAQYDKILLDAPCSGEGMMLLDHAKDFESWSVAHIKRLQKLQKQIITQAWKALKPGGTLVYSTCTIAPEENEAVVDYLLRRQPEAQIVPPTSAMDLQNRVPSVTVWHEKSYDPRIKDALRLQNNGAIEAFFVCAISKESRSEDTDFYRP